jgi:ATP-dependent Clp protease adaptor protein ClpS
MPGMYAVVMYNDEITTMDFVVDVLVKVFHKSTLEASNIMMDIHHRGQGIAGIYTFDIAVTKKSQADRLSAEKGFPLKLAVQEAI